MSVTWAQVLARRLDRHGLTSPAAPDRLAAQVDAMCGAHAQVMSAAEVSVGLRVAGATRADVRAALWTERTVVKSFGPRGTVHLLPASRLPAWNAVLAAALEQPRFEPGIRLTPDQTDAVVGAIDDALATTDLTVDELDAEVVRRTGSWAGDRVMPAFQDLWPRWRQALRTAAFRGALCFGPNRGAKVTYASPRRWLGAARPRPADEAGIEIVRGYLHAYGPAAPEHVARWLGCSPAWAREQLRNAGTSVERMRIEDDELWQLAGDPFPASGTARQVQLLPYFDAYSVGSHPRERVFPGRAAERALARTQAGNYPVLLVDGIVEGVWHQRRAGTRLRLTVEPFRPLRPSERRSLEEQVDRVAEIQEATATMTLGPVTAGPHA